MTYRPHTLFFNTYLCIVKRNKAAKAGSSESSNNVSDGDANLSLTIIKRENENDDYNEM